MDFQSKGIKLIMGLGNPGADYKDTYHNAGAIFIEFLANQKKAGNLILTKSPAFMNESGNAIKKALSSFKIKSPEILVVHDDSDLQIGKRKFSFGRGAGGHKGIESAISALKTKDFWRLRIGIRPLIKAGLPAEGRFKRPKAGSFVLKKIKTADKKILESLFRKIVEEKF